MVNEEETGGREVGGAGEVLDAQVGSVRLAGVEVAVVGWGWLGGEVG